MMTQKALFMTFLGELVHGLATRLQKRGFEIVVANCQDTHSCFQSRGMPHKFCIEQTNAVILDNFCEDLRSDLLCNGVVVVNCDFSMSSLSFEMNMQLRRVITLTKNIWFLSDTEDLEEFDRHFGHCDDAEDVAKRNLGCKLLKKLAEYDQRIYQAIRDDMFPLDFTREEQSDSSDRRRASSHPELPSQPLITPGQTTADGLYRNRFGRRGRELHSEIILKRGILQELSDYYAQLLPAACLDAQNFVVVDEICDRVLNVDGTFISALAQVGVECLKIVIPSNVSDESGETSTEPYKTQQVLAQCVDTILAHGVSKHSCVISVGGGVVNNLCGVLAGLLYRGIHLVHVTTTTMGMLDAALDFKQAINHPFGKNLLGCYYPAERIIIDPAVCQSLSVRHVRNGIAEALKHGLCQSEELVSRIVDPVRELGEAVFHSPEYVEDICKASIEIKVPTLDHYSESDYNEMCPQYGHAIGHAVEALSWSPPHAPLLHGEAVAIGMCVSAEISYARGYCDTACLEDHYRHVLDLGLPAYIPASMTTAMVLGKIVYDKHYVNIPSMGLVAAVGELACDREHGNTFAFGVAVEELVAALETNMGRRNGHGVPDSNGSAMHDGGAGVAVDDSPYRPDR